jgi:hypothetical protein
MKLKKYLSLTAITLLITMTMQNAKAHEGHDKIPGASVAKYGGQVKGTDELYVEVVPEGSQIKIYVYDHDKKNTDLKTVTLTGEFKLPKQKKSEPLTITLKENYFETTVNSKNAHRFNVELKVTHNNKTEKLRYVLEPQ